MRKINKLLAVLLAVMILFTTMPTLALETMAQDVVDLVDDINFDIQSNMSNSNETQQSDEQQLATLEPQRPTLYANDATGSVTYSYYLDSYNNATISGYSGSPIVMNIPSKLDGYKVVGISTSAFSGCTSLTEVIIPDSVTRIENYAFSDCTSLTSVTLSKSLTYIGYYVFRNTKIESIEIPKTLTSCNNSDSSYYTLNGKEYRIYYGPFAGCETLKNITIEHGMTKIPNGLLRGCVGVESITLPDTVTEIGGYAFADCLRLNEINLSSSVNTIGAYAFDQCISLAEFTIPENVVTINERAFYRCAALTKIEIPDSVITIGDYAFSSCTSLAEATLSRQLVSIGSCVFNGTKIESIDIPKTLTSSGESYEGPFAGCETLKTVTIEYGMTRIPSYLLEGCTALENFVISDTVTTVGSYAFSGCEKLSNITIGDSVTSIGNYAFSGCTSLTEVVIPDSVTRIENSAFSDCTSLTSVTLSKSLTYIGYYVFRNTKIESIEIPKTLTSCNYSGSSYYTLNGKEYRIYYGPFAGCETLKDITIEHGMTKIPNYLLRGCVGVESITLPDTVTEIGGYAFADCLRLKKINLSDNIKTIGNSAFSQCLALQEITIPKSITIIENSTFSGCAALESVSFAAGTRIKEIKSGAFYGCKSLKEAILPESVAFIGDNAYAYCSSLEKVYIPQSTKTLEYAAFMGCESLVDVIICDYSIKTISSATFMDCSLLGKITLPKGLTTIEYRAFANDYSLYEVVMPQSVTSIDATAFSYPKKITMYGQDNTYVQKFASQYGFNFVNNLVPANGIALVGEEKYIILDRGQTYRAVFEFYPNDSTDIVNLVPSNSKVTINGHDIYAAGTGETVITAHATSGVTYEFTVCIRDVKEFAIASKPTKLVYSIGEELDLTGLKLQVKYTNDSIEDITDYTVSGFDSRYEGKCNVVIEWMSSQGGVHTTNFTVDIIDTRPKMTSIFVDTLPNKIEYARREELDLTGLVIKANYTDGSVAEVYDYTVTGYNALDAKVQTLTVRCGEFETQFSVTVGVWMTEISLNTLPDKLDYYIGDRIDTTGLKINVIYVNGYTEVVDTGYMVMVNTDSIGKKTVTVNYNGFTTSFNIDVISPTIILSEKNKTLKVGDSLKLSVATTPINQDVQWATSNNNVAVVDGGNVTALSAGNVVITASILYNNKSYQVSCNVLVEPQDAVYTSLDVQTLPNKTVYVLGEKFDATGLSLKQNYSDGSYTIITSGYTVLDVDTNTPGVKTVMVVYQGILTFFDIEVKAPIFDENSPTFAVENKIVKPGDTFTVEVSTKNNCGISSLRLLIGYDTDALEFVAAGERDFADMSFGPDSANPLVINWVNTLEPDNTTDGVIAVLMFKVKENATIGSTNITVDYEYEDIYNSNFENVIFATQDGAIIVTNSISGDINNDDSINNKDLGVLLQYVNGWDVIINTNAADVNKDGAINNKDYVLIQRYINGWDVELL